VSKTVTHAVAHLIPTQVDLRSTLHSTFLAYIGNMSSDHTKMLAFTALWDVNHEDYTNKIKRNDALNALAMN
jgi:hypothetical protein